MNQLANIGNLNITSWELVILLFLLGGGFLLGILLGRNRVFLLLLGSYISFALMMVIPFKIIFPEYFDNEENFVVTIVAFLVLIGIVYFLLSRSMKKSLKNSAGKSLFQVFFLSLFFIGIVVSVVFMFFPEDLIKAFSPLILQIFNTITARVLWLVIPLIFIGIFKGRQTIVRGK
jgi:cbb3-type cytochrome oxidase subunit 3